MFSFDLSDELKKKLRILSKRDGVFCNSVNKKIKEIINNDAAAIDRYKNLRHDLSDHKRVHVHKSFVLTFKVVKDSHFIFFEKIEHHDDTYKK